MNGRQVDYFSVWKYVSNLPPVLDINIILSYWMFSFSLLFLDIRWQSYCLCVLAFSEVEKTKKKINLSPQNNFIH